MSTAAATAVAHWRLTNQLLFLYEVDTDALLRLMPEELEPAEVRPGVALVGLEWLHYAKDHFRDGTAEFDEIVFAASVQPNLALAMPSLPRFCIHGLSITSNSREFIDDECRPLFKHVDYRPTLRVVPVQGGLGCDIFDGDELVVSAHNANADASFEPKTMWGQFYTDANELQQGVWRWRGEVFEHMKRDVPGVFRPHPMFRGLDLARIRHPFRQMVSRPGSTSLLTRWLPGVTPAD